MAWEGELFLKEGEVSAENDNKRGTKMLVMYNYSLFVICVLFGIGAWILINAIFSQMPMLVINSPEGWNLPSYLSLLVQLANISPLAYSLLKHKKYFLSDANLIFFFMALGVASMSILAFTYDKTSIIFGQVHSTFLFVLSFLMSMVGCTSSVLFLPFMNILPESYLIPYFIGEGISGFLPSVLALLQGTTKTSTCINVTSASGNVTTAKVYNPPLFNSTIFFLIISFFMALSALSFLYLIFNPRYKEIKIQQTSNNYDDGNKENTPLSSTLLSNTLSTTLLSIQLVVNMLGNGLLPSLESYSCLPYGINAYHWAVNLGQITSPITFYASVFLPLQSLSLLIILIFLCFICLIYQIITAFLSPNPPFVGSTLGVLIVVVVWVLSNATIAYVKLSIATIFRKKKQAQGLFHYGVVTQVGSAIGSFLSFCLINYTNLLHSSNTEQC